MRTVAVIGAGQMGTGIAQTVAQHGMQVLLADVDRARAEAGRASIDKALGKLVGRGKLEIAEAEAALGRISAVGDYAPMADAELIIEAATEREEIKKAIFEAAGKVLASDAIMASNTSSIPITRMANFAPDAARFIGEYTAKGVFKTDPFISLDIEGVGELVRIGTERGRQAKPGLKAGICG
ncbi:MAG: 3-hydroxyacyl-CoA dehydrogenase NAD-binding domain-containing protein, partial [Erythrobacter sp.]